MSLKDVDQIRWFHSFEFDDGERINGIKSLETLNAEASVILPAHLEGKSVLDIGSWDGFFSFEAEKRGASRVVSSDHFCWSGNGWGTRDGFDFVHARLGSRVEPLDIDIDKLDPAILGQFDLVLFLGVFYHLKDPYVGLERAAQMCRDHIVIETVTALPRETQPAMRLFAPRELADDPTNFWAPNVPALELMLRSFGFTTIEAMPSPVSINHPLELSRLRRPGAKATHRTIVHATR